MPKASTFTPHIASQMVDSDRFPFIPNAGGNGTITVTEFRDVVGLGWGFTINAARFAGIDDEAKIQAAIDHAVNVTAPRVFVPSSMLPYDASAVTFSDAVQMVREGGSFDVWDVMAYGAAGDGVTLDTVAIQATLDACNSAGAGTVYVPPGTYLTDQLDMPGNNITVTGAGSAYVYNSAGTVRTVFKAKTGTYIVWNLAVTGLINDRTGCLLQDFEVDGDLLAPYGIVTSAANLINRVRVKNCTVAGVLLANYTNGTHLSSCALVGNYGYGLQAQGLGTTVFSAVDTNISLNQTGGLDLEAGVLANFKRCIFESNSGPGIRIYKPDTHTGAMGSFTFEDSWIEDNGLNTPYFSLAIDAETRNETNAPWRIRFINCRFAPSLTTRKYANIMCAKWITFEDCQFAGSDEADTLTLGAEARFVALLECEKGVDGSSTLTAAQIDSAVAAGTRCYWSQRGQNRVVDSGAPAAAFVNSWVNFGGALPTAKYWFDREGNVHLEGTIKTGTINTVAFTLPVGYRPTTTQKFAVISNGAIGELEIQTDGDVLPVSGSNVSFNLNGVYFTTA